jgi:hypothetical protein
VTAYQNVVFDATDLVGVSRLDNEANSELDGRTLASSRGLELMLARPLTDQLGGLVSYTLSRSQRALGRASGPSAYDRTHVVNLALAYEPGRGWQIGARAAFYTGIPGNVAYVEAARQPPRTPVFYRLDWRVEKSWQLGDRSLLAVIVEVLNTTLRSEVLDRSCSAYSCRDRTIGPLTIPSIGIRASHH